MHYALSIVDKLICDAYNHQASQKPCNVDDTADLFNTSKAVLERLVF